MDAHSNSALLHVQKKCISVSISWPQEEQKASSFIPILCKNGFNANLRCYSRAIGFSPGAIVHDM